MTNPSLAPSLLQAGEPASNSNSHSHSSPRYQSKLQSHSLQQQQKQNRHARDPGSATDTNHLQRHHQHSSNQQERHHHHRQRSAKDSAPERDDETRAEADQVAILEIRGASAVDLTSNADTLKRSPSLVTHVIQTVSLYQYIDASGSPIATQTRYAPPNTVVVDSVSGQTFAISHPAVSSLLAPAQNAPSSSHPTISSTQNIVTTSAPVTHAPSQSGINLTSIPSSNSSAYPSWAGAQNGTNTIHGGNSSHTLSGNSTTFKALSGPITLSHTSGFTFSRTHSADITFSTSGFPSFTSASATPSGKFAHDSSSAPGGTSDSPPLTPQQKQVIGGVVGSVAGVAFLAVLLMLVLRYKRRLDARAKVGDGQSGAASGRAITDGGNGGDSGGEMAERSAAAAAVTAAFSGLVGKRNTVAPPPPEGGERGFYRVSGRKLPSVLYAGGDGYSDPRESVLSEQSDYFRGSQAFDPNIDHLAGGKALLALGAPMRPISGVPIMRSGPARTPVTERNPFVDPPTPPTPPSQDGSGRVLGSRGSPRGSTSRFQEGV